MANTSLPKSYASHFQFPMDKITCLLTFESYNYNRNMVRMIWNQPTPVQLFKDIELPDFSMVNFTWKTTAQVGSLRDQKLY